MLREFVLACLHDDELRASAATPGPWRRDVCPGVSSGRLLSSEGDLVARSWGGDADFIAAHSPVEASRAIAMKRAILDHHGHTKALSHWTKGADFGCGVCHVFNGLVAGYGWCHTVRLLAASFPGRVGFDPAWAVEL